MARNAVGWSLNSTVLTVLLAKLPDKPTNVVTSLNGDYVNVSWTAPAFGSSPITRYYINVRTSDNVVFAQETTGCAGT